MLKSVDSQHRLVRQWSQFLQWSFLRDQVLGRKRSRTGDHGSAAVRGFQREWLQAVRLPRDAPNATLENATAIAADGRTISKRELRRTSVQARSRAIRSTASR